MRRFVVAAVLGVLGVFLVFLLGEGQKSELVLFAGIGAYFLIAMFLLSLGAGHVRRGLTLLALDAAILVALVLTVLIERQRMAVLETLGLALVAVVGSLLGWVLAARIPRRTPRVEG